MPSSLTIWKRFETAPSLWESTARTVVVDALSRARQEAATARKDLLQDLHSFLDGDHRSQLEARLAVLYPDASRTWNEDEAGHRFFPLVQMYADRLGVVFHQLPETYLVDGDGKRLPEDDAQQIQWSRDVESLELDVQLQTAESWINSGMRQVFVQPCIRRGRLQWEVHAPYEVDVDQDPDSPSALEGAPHVMVCLPQRNDSVSRAAEEDLFYTWQRVDTRDAWGRVIDTEWRCWLHDKTGQLYRNPLFTDNVNDYGLHPLVVWRDRKPAKGDFWVTANKAWYHQQLSADIKFCDLDHHLRHQIHSQPVVKGAPDIKKLPLGPDKPIQTLDVDFDFSYVNADPKLELLISAFNFDLRASAVAESMPADMWEPNSSTRNLAAKKLEQHALQVRRTKVLPFYRRALKRTFEVHRVVANHWAEDLKRTRYSPDVTLGVEFAPLPEVVDRFQDTQANELDIRHGVTSPTEVRMRREGVTRSDAEQRIAIALGLDQEAEEGVPQVEEASVLNGAQLNAAAAIVLSVATGQIPLDSGLGQLVVMFNLTHDQAKAIMGSVGSGFVPTIPEATVPGRAPGRPPADAAPAGVARSPDVERS
ncbi:hypothetical protein CMI37_09575 [Candidatus Pacearchaeota archaeon]|nr:hypothetical protein [Candidatus Pacearchaeota archaeon]